MFGFITEKFSSLLSGISNSWKSDSKEKIKKQLRTILIEADVPYKMVDEFSEKVIARFEEQVKALPKQDKNELLKTAIYKELLAVLGSDTSPAKDWPQNGIILFLGLQGAGKTTSLSKIGKWLEEHRPKAKGKVFCTSVDFQRPAAIEQLKIMAGKAGIEFISPVGTDIDQTIKSALETSSQHKDSFLLVDSAGRLNTDDELMAELKHLCQILKPTLKVLVLDSMTGQQSLEVAKDFQSSVGVDSTILTKVDSDSRAGCALSLRWATQKTVSFVANGEKVDDLEPFVASRVASRVLGSGDVATLSEKIESQLKKTGQDTSFNSMAGRMAKGAFTLKDFLKQIELVNSLGSIGKLASYLPGMGSISSQQLKEGDREMACFRSIIQSMTDKERIYPAMIDKSRKKRIVEGSGRKMSDLDRLLEKFEQSKRFAKILSRFGR